MQTFRAANIVWEFRSSVSPESILDECSSVVPEALGEASCKMRYGTEVYL